MNYATHSSTRRFQPVAVQKAAREAPVLAQLIARGERSSQYLKAIANLLPEGLRSSVTAGPIEDGTWCLLVNGHAVTSKLRQLVPALEAHLRTHGFEPVSIRLRVSSQAHNPSRWR